jgi:hypothetical protein
MIAYDRLQQIIPQGIALANKALSAGLQQIGGISKMTLPVLANAIGSLQSVNHLPLVASQTSAVPPEVAQFYANLNSTTGSGPGNTVVVADILGTPSGYNYIDPLSNTLSEFSAMDMSQLTLIYQTMLNVVNNVYGVSPVVIPPGTPGAGTYSSQDSAVSTGLIPLASAEIVTLTTTYPVQTAQLNTDWQTMGNQWLGEQSLQQQAGIDFTSFPANSQTSVFSFVGSLPSYGQTPLVGEANWYLTSVANQSSFYGQSIVACLQQGSNELALSNAGIITSYNIPDSPT